MPMTRLPTKGMVCRHHSGRVYTVLDLSNTYATVPDARFPVTVIYLGANGNVWSRPLIEFVQKFDVLYDGNNLAP